MLEWLNNRKKNRVLKVLKQNSKSLFLPEKYGLTAFRNADENPKDIYGLMKGFSMWESKPAFSAIQRLVDEGLLIAMEDDNKKYFVRMPGTAEVSLIIKLRNFE